MKWFLQITDINKTKDQGRRKGGAEGANAPSIFGKLHHLIPILGYVKKLATIAIVQNLVAPSILSPCAAPAT